jgi:16S rRNA (uracil1498-N3)-methyltransferase
MMAVLAEPGSLTAGCALTLSDEEAHHLKVRHAGDGEVVRVQDGQGSIATGMLAWSKKRATVHIASVETLESPPPLMLAVGAGDKDRFGWLAEKAAELGVTELIPLATERTAAVATRLREAHLAKLEGRARDAIKQSGAAWSPRIAACHSVAELCARPRSGKSWVAERGGESPPVRIGPEAMTVAIGPEGGWTERELGQLAAAGFRSIALAPHILRFETAAVAAAVIIGAARLRGTRD